MTLLKNKKILITKSKLEAENSVRSLINEGAHVIYLPTIKIIPLFESEPLQEALSIISDIDYIIFTSVNAAEVFSKICSDRKLDLTHTKVAAVGTVTADKCRALGFYIHIVPEEYSASGLLKKFSGLYVSGKKIIIPCSSLSRDELSIGLAELGAEVLAVPIYDVVENSVDELQSEIEMISQNKPDIFVFTSPSSFENFLKLINVEDKEEYFGNRLIAAIGTTTENAIKESGVAVHIVPNIFTLQGLSEAIIKHFYLSQNIA